MLPRPARLVRQSHLSCRGLASAVRLGTRTTVQVDESYLPFLHHVDATRRLAPLQSALPEAQLVTDNLSLEDGFQPLAGPQISEEELERRPERRSPAAVLGSKRIGSVILPQALIDGVQREIYGEKSELLPSSETALAKVAAILPGQYAVVRNILNELDKRLESGWMDGPVIDVSGGSGAGIWATMDYRDQLGLKDMEYQLVHASKHGRDLAKRLVNNPNTMRTSNETSESGLPGNTKFLFTMKPSPELLSKVFVMSTFHLSTLPTVSSRKVHIRQLLSLSSSYIILVDRANPAGWEAISSARTQLLSLSTPENPLHVIAPCPHDGPCPLVGLRDICGFSQRLQRPSFVRKTKHSKRGDEDVGYTYLVIGRGPRPVSVNSNEGRIGGVGLEAAQKERDKKAGKSELHRVEGGEYEMVSLLPHDLALDTTQSPEIPDLRGEAYRWPRLVAAPMKRSGHVIMDVCCTDEKIKRIIFAKSHSKQVYHDARKATWGDIFPHEPKSKSVERTRGLRRLMPAEVDFDGVPMGSEAEMSLAMEGWPVGELVEGDGELDEDGIITYQSPSPTLSSSSLSQSERPSSGSSSSEPATFSSGSSSLASSLFSSNGQRREFSSSSRRSSVHPTDPPPGSGRRKVTISHLRHLASQSIPITCLTAYDYPTSLISETCGVDMVLVGDSLSQVCLGHSTTTQITLEEMIHHCKAVTRGAKTPFIFADLPFGSFESDITTGIKSSIRLIKEGLIDGIKIEGGEEIIPLIKQLNKFGIPTIPHLGLQPQRAISLSGYLVQGRDSLKAFDIYELSKKMELAGCTMILLEAIPHKLASKITNDLNIPTIGIGAGNGTSGQVLVISDVLGMYEEGLGGKQKAKFVRHFGEVGKEMRKAVEGYVKEVKSGGFPKQGEETYSMKKEEWLGFEKLIEGSASFSSSISKREGRGEEGGEISREMVKEGESTEDGQ
ncbi:3-methyl-2-oxobutanoate hydroxymethyltransferase [Tremella mesenterica]|uniref:3-methyl-2-oxobutanoate hydroxymethyltransferase n=1 Tax=Tremella mesenterica TaxID=5217 RepID=A0A4Q1B7W0_TREME|nr:3-methyl-2-oxobutanoate hydroxymethyltransferase [Tremella mesenterica]